jgi:hypothetical protein
MHITDKLTGMTRASQISPLQDSLTDLLDRGIVVVTFKKTNGEVREMTCTKNITHIPPSMLPKGTGNIITNKNTIRVFDINAQGWRSFIKQNVIGWSSTYDNQQELGL